MWIPHCPAFLLLPLIWNCLFPIFTTVGASPTDVALQHLAMNLPNSNVIFKGAVFAVTKGGQTYNSIRIEPLLTPINSTFRALTSTFHIKYFDFDILIHAVSFWHFFKPTNYSNKINTCLLDWITVTRKYLLSHCNCNKGFNKNLLYTDLLITFNKETGKSAKNNQRYCKMVLVSICLLHLTKL